MTDDVQAAARDSAMPAGGQTVPPPARGRARARLALGLVVLIALAAAGTYWWLTRNEITTDDAFIDGHAITLAPRIAGTVVALEVRDNQRVVAGQTLLRIDPRSYVAARDAAAARLVQAKALASVAAVRLAQVQITAPARLAAARARLAAATAEAMKADANWRRERRLPRAATTQQALDDATAAHLAADAARARAGARLREADTVAEQIAVARARRAEQDGAVALARARLAAAELDLRWTRLRAPASGWVTRRMVEQGNEVAPGQAVLALVTPKVWVRANFKETALDRIRPGEKVRIRVDAYPELRLTGHVDSIQHGTGARFSAFPAENATGNFVKIVQRVPVKIDIDSGLDPARPLPLGLSVEPTIRLR